MPQLDGGVNQKKAQIFALFWDKTVFSENALPTNPPFAAKTLG
jgi:hypothetical protein